MRNGNNHNQGRRSRGNRRRGGGGGNNPNRQYESNGPEGRVRGNAQTIADKYVTLSRDAAAAGNRILAENFLQHAEHYYRILASLGVKFTRADVKQDEIDLENEDDATDGDDEEDQENQPHITGQEDQPTLGANDDKEDTNERPQRKPAQRGRRPNANKSNNADKPSQEDTKVAAYGESVDASKGTEDQPQIVEPTKDAEQLPAFLTEDLPKKPRVAKSVRPVKKEKAEPTAE